MLRDLVYVGHMPDMARKAVAKVRDLPREAYDADENLRLALIHLVQVIGEAARQVSRELTATHPEIPWENIVGMRHKVVTTSRLFTRIPAALGATQQAARGLRAGAVGRQALLKSPDRPRGRSGSCPRCS